MIIYSLDVILSHLESVFCSMFSSNCCFLNCVQISQEAGKVVWYSHLLMNFQVCCDPHSQRLTHHKIISSLVAQMVKNLPAIQETPIQSLGWEDTLEKGIATHSSILAWKIPWTEEPDRLQSMGLQKSWIRLSN